MIKILSIALVLLSGIVLWQGCDVQKAVFESMEQAKLAGSAHGDNTAEAFRHWDEDTPPLVATGCAKCHSIGGFLEYITTGAVANAAKPGAFDCTLCHTDSEKGITRTFENGVKFPSGAVIKNLGSEALCMTCHQGRQSTVSVNTLITNSGAAIDTPTTKISFPNVHYLAAAATMYGTFVKGGYQYTGKTYDAKFAHIAGYGACIDCHDSHSLEVKVENCKTCHPYVKSKENLHDIRWLGSEVDYDGNGNITEGMYYEVGNLKDKLLTAIKAYASQVSMVKIAYDAATNPYFFIDTNGNGIVDPSEAVSANKYNAFTPRLVRAAYNYQYTIKDPGGFAHGGKYIIELLYDSIQDLTGATPVPADIMAGLHRTDEGHFDGSSEAWRHWDVDGAVPAGCARCHSSTGLAEFIATGANTSTAPLSNGMLCTTCHTSPPSVRKLSNVAFPSGVKVSLGDASNLCMACHQGRAFKGSIDTAIAAKPGDYSFTNIHYFPAAAVFFGSTVHGGYEYTGKTYAGQSTFPNHGGDFNTCIQCHMGTKSIKGHNVAEPNPANCVLCHGQDVAQPFPGADPEKFSFDGIRPGSIPDYDADGDMTESLADEIHGLEAALLTQIQAYCTALGKPIAYSAASYPYFFKDLNGNGIVDANEATSANGYKFDAKSLKAGYNYQLSIKEPHGYIHNAPYIAQLLTDSIGDLGGSVAKYTWR